MNLASFIGDKIDRISYWDDKGILNITTKHQEMHFNIRGIEIDFTSGKKLTIDYSTLEQGLDFGNTSLGINEWDDNAIYVDMSQHRLLKNLIGKQVSNIQIWWCDNLWISGGRRSGPKSYKQDLTNVTEGNGYFLCSSAEANEATPSIYLIDSDEIVIITDENIAKKNELEKYGKGKLTRYTIPKT